MFNEIGLPFPPSSFFDNIPLYKKYQDKIEADCTDDEFMALFEQMPEFDNYDDDFVVNEERWTAQVAYYIDEHVDRFAVIEA